MSSNHQDYQYWISRKVKISEEYNDLRRIKQKKLQDLEQQKAIREANSIKIEELKRKIAELKGEIYDSRSSIFNLSKATDSILNKSSPILTSIKKRNFFRQFTKEFEHSQRSIEDIKNNDLIDKIFECFLIIGTNTENTESEILFALPTGNEFIESPQGRVIGNFAFPIGIKSRKVRESNIISELKKLFNGKIERNGKHFTFSIKYEIERPRIRYKDRANYRKESLYCSCVMIEELVDVDMEGNYIIQPRCYCLVSYYPCFELQFKLLFYSINLKIKAEKDLINQQKDNYWNQQSIQKIMIGEYLDCAKNIMNQAKNLSISFKQVNIEDFEYAFPIDWSDLDNNWFCPLIFSLLRLEDVIYILFAILQEASVVFLSQNMDFLGSCILGFQGLLRPYAWPHLIVPILPLSLFEILEAPVPLLVGIPKTSKLSVKALTHFIIVDLDNNNINHKIQEPINNSARIHVPDIKKENLIEWYAAFNNGPCYNPTPDQLKKCKRIVSKFKNYIKGLFNNLSIIQDRIDSTNVQDLETIIIMLKSLEGNDVEFKHNFYNTQMCINAIEEYYSGRVSYTGRSFELS